MTTYGLERMYTADSLSELDNDQRKSILNELCTEFFGTERWKSEFARQTGLSSTVVVSNWYADRANVPIWAILLAFAWMDQKQTAVEAESVKRTLERVRNLIGEEVKPTPPEEDTF